MNNDYKEFLDTLYQRHSGNVKYGLERIIAILADMGNPQQKLTGIHVAGTNGKGSVSAMCETLALAHGHTTGMNTSPHLVSYTERFRINGQNPSLDTIKQVYQQWRQVFEAHEASFFEITTAMAFYLFYSKKLQTSVFEVGLGGRLDGTNPFKSAVSVITSISYDHPKSLGDTVEQIAAEKAGIIKPGQPVVIGQMENSPLKVIMDIAKHQGATIYLRGRDFDVTNIHCNEHGTSFDYSCPALGLNLPGLKTNLLGQHQAGNAAVALTAFGLYMQSINQQVNPTQLAAALNQVNWPGRLQVLSANPPLLVDGAHNEEGVTALIKSLKEIFPECELKIVVAILRDKKLDTMIADLGKLSAKLYISKNHSTRAAEIEEQVVAAKSVNATWQTFEDVVDATKAAIKEHQPGQVIVVTGSLYTISEILAVKDELL